VKINSIHLRTADLQRAKEFYVGLLGFETADGENGTLELYSAIDQEPLITLEEAADAQPRPAGTTGLYHAALLMPDRTELARILKRLGEERYPLQGFADHGVSEAIYLADPDGNGLELYADHPRDLWPHKRGEIEMYTRSLDLENLLSEIKDDESEWDGVHPDTTMGHIHLQVSDLKKSGEFYHDVLGLDVMQQNFPGALFLAADGYHHYVGLNAWNTLGGTPAPKGSIGLVRFSVETSDLITLRHLQLQFQHRGYALQEIPTDGNSMPALLVHDPDDIELQIVVRQRVLVN
jgi:catechol 2,3-dioxygenase